MPSALDDPKSHLLSDGRRLEKRRNVARPHTDAGAHVTSCGQSFEGDEVERMTMDEIAHLPGEVAERREPDAGGKGDELRRDPPPEICRQLAEGAAQRA